MRTTNTTGHWLKRPALLLFAGFAVTGHAGAQQAAAAPETATKTFPAADASPSGEQAAPQTVGERCGAAYERTQTEKVAGHYVAATAAALQCSQLECNAAIVKECVRFYESLQEDTPTMVFSARKAEGGELADVRVEIDGKPAVDQITGRPVALDPGSHDFVFIHAQRGRMQLTETARVGDHARVLEVTFADPNAKAGADVGSTPATQVDRPRRVPVMTYVLGGVGAVALGSFVYFRLQAVSHYNDYNATCSPNCDQAKVDDLRREFLFSYISVGLSVASFTGAGLVYFLTPNGSSREVQASVTPHGDGAIVGLRTKF